MPVCCAQFVPASRTPNIDVPNRAMYTETSAWLHRVVLGRDRSKDDKRDTKTNDTLTKNSSDRIPQGTCRLDRLPEGNAGRGGERAGRPQGLRDHHSNLLFVLQGFLSDDIFFILCGLLARAAAKSLLNLPSRLPMALCMYLRPVLLKRGIVNK
jgi:hypothetical protein